MSVRQAARLVARFRGRLGGSRRFVAITFASPAGAPSSGPSRRKAPLHPAHSQLPAGQCERAGQLDLQFCIGQQHGRPSDCRVLDAQRRGPSEEHCELCDDWTQQGPTVVPNSDGSIVYDGYTIVALPDTAGGESGSPITCGTTLQTECSLYIGDNFQSDGEPHVWSQPFFVKTDATDSGTINPGDGTPEVPLAIILPVSALGLLGATVAIRRRRTVKAAA